MMNGKNFTNTLSDQESKIRWMNKSASMEKSASIAPRTNLLEFGAACRRGPRRVADLAGGTRAGEKRLRPRDVSRKICGEVEVY